MRHLHGEHMDDKDNLLAGYANLRACLPGWWKAEARQPVVPTDAPNGRVAPARAAAMAWDASCPTHDPRKTP